MHRVLLLGAGKIGRMIARLLIDSGDYAVTVGDVSPDACDLIAERIRGVKVFPVDVASPAEVAKAVAGCDSVISSLSYFLNPLVAETALAAGASHFDLTEAVTPTRPVRQVEERPADAQVSQP